uniref:Uncharacterized protein n=1 Tax=Romanomermis culicivorax TaxID=13658 RepID=A0A915K8H8_ROMCU
MKVWPLALLLLRLLRNIFCADESVAKMDNCDYFGLDIVLDDRKILRLDGLTNQQCEESCIRKRE